jgi:hypothetical protein
VFFVDINAMESLRKSLRVMYTYIEDPEMPLVDAALQWLRTELDSCQYPNSEDRSKLL